MTAFRVKVDFRSANMQLDKPFSSGVEAIENGRLSRSSITTIKY